MTEIATCSYMAGSQTFRHSSSRVLVHVYSSEHNRVYPGQAPGVNAERTGSVYASHDQYSPHGMWNKFTMSAPDGTVLGIHLKSTYNGALHTSCMFMFRLRSDAPLVQVTARLARAKGAVYSVLPVLRGRGDPLTVEEVDLLGLKFTGNARDILFDEEEIEEEFSVEELAPGSDKGTFVAITNGEGKAKIIQVKGENRRRIRVRK